MFWHHKKRQTTKTQVNDTEAAIAHLSDKYAIFITKDDYVVNNYGNIFNNICTRNGAIYIRGMVLNFGIYTNVPIDSNDTYGIAVFGNKDTAKNAYEKVNAYIPKTFMLEGSLGEILGLQVQLSNASTKAEQMITT